MMHRLASRDSSTSSADPRSRDLSGKVAVVTGGADGIGRATATLLARRGATVVIADINAPGALRAAATIRELSGLAEAVVADVLKVQDVFRMVEHVFARHAAVHILVNNVGGSTGATPPRRGVDAMGPDEWERLIAFNLRGTFLCTRAVIPLMKRQRYGRIINVSSILARGDSTNGNAAYATGKAGIAALTRRLAVELGPFGITCNAIAPGVTLTDRIRRFRKNHRSARLIAAREIPLARFACPDDQARVIAFLASDESSYVSGQTIEVAGGF